MRMVAPTNREHKEYEHSAAELHRAPPLKGTSAATKLHTNNATTFTALSVGILIDPTLCTCRELGFPHHPTARAAEGGRGMLDSLAGEVDRLGMLTKLPLSTEDGDGNGKVRKFRFWTHEFRRFMKSPHLLHYRREHPSQKV
jgi:hypothetical protein